MKSLIILVCMCFYSLQVMSFEGVNEQVKIKWYGLQSFKKENELYVSNYIPFGVERLIQPEFGGDLSLSSLWRLQFNYLQFPWWIGKGSKSRLQINRRISEFIWLGGSYQQQRILQQDYDYQSIAFTDVNLNYHKERWKVLLDYSRSFSPNESPKLYLSVWYQLESKLIFRTGIFVHQSESYLEASLIYNQEKFDVGIDGRLDFNSCEVFVNYSVQNIVFHFAVHNHQNLPLSYRQQIAKKW